MNHEKPALTGTSHPLSFDRLSPLDFERLCLALLPREGFADPRHLGAAGGERGRDIVAYRDGARWYVQCKRVEKCGPQVLLAEVEKIQDLITERPDLRPAGLLFMVSCDVSATAEDRAAEACKSLGLACEVWARTDLDWRVQEHPDLVERFFGQQVLAAEALPVLFTVPFRRNERFVGRDEELAELHRLLQEGQSAIGITPAGISGMGGIGKTQLAVEYAHRYRDAYPGGVFWINCAQPDAINTEIALCGAAMNLPAWPRELPEQVSLTLQTWRDGRAYLVLLDNLESVDAAGKWLPCLARGGVRLLLTARRADWPSDLGLAPQHLDIFSPLESLAFLRKYLPPHRAPDADLDHLAERLGHLPLALELAGCYLMHLPHLSVLDYRDSLAEILEQPSFSRFCAHLDDPAGPDLALAATFFQSWQAVQSDTARRLFLLAGHCPPNQPIPFELLQMASRERDSDSVRKRMAQLFGKKPSQPHLDEALRLLTDLGLLKMDGLRTGLTIHTVLAEYARTLPGEQKALSDLTRARGVLEQPLPFGISPSRFRAILVALLMLQLCGWLNKLCGPNPGNVDQYMLCGAFCCSPPVAILPLIGFRWGRKHEDKRLVRVSIITGVSSLLPILYLLCVIILRAIQQ